jgi:non-ribosomal peptide synthetase component F
LPIQYGDFATWQQEWLAGEDFEEQLAYWRHQLGNELPSLEIPTDFPRNKNRTSFGAIESLLLPHPLSRAIKVMANREDVTPYMVFLSAFNVLLHRYSGQDQILVGSPTACRITSETEGLIGPFANTLLLKTDLSGDPSFKTLLQRVKEVSLGAFSNQTLPFERLVETVKLASARKGSQLFQVLFVLQTAFMQPTEANGLTITPIRSVSPGSIFEILMGVVERAEGARLQLEYNTNLFKVETIRQMLDDLHAILRFGVLDRDRKLSELVLELNKPVTPVVEVSGSTGNFSSGVTVPTNGRQERSPGAAVMLSLIHI